MMDTSKKMQSGSEGTYLGFNKKESIQRKTDKAVIDIFQIRQFKKNKKKDTGLSK